LIYRCTYGSLNSNHSMLRSLDYERVAVASFLEAGNNFELAKAVAKASFEAKPNTAFTTVIGPLIKVPAMISLANVALTARKIFPSNTSPHNHQAERTRWARLV